MRGLDPPTPDWDAIRGACPEFERAQLLAREYGYDASRMALRDASARPHFLCIAQSAKPRRVAWFVRTEADCAGTPRARIPRDTYVLFRDGTLDVSTMTIWCEGTEFLLELRTDSGGAQIAYPRRLG